MLSNHQKYFSRNHVRLGDIEARLPIDRSSTSYEDQEHGTNLVGRHLTISISKYDLKSDIDIDEIDIDIDLDWYFHQPSQQPVLWPGLANFRATRSRREAYSEIQETRFTLKARRNVEIEASL